MDLIFEEVSRNIIYNSYNKKFRNNETNVVNVPACYVPTLDIKIHPLLIEHILENIFTYISSSPRGEQSLLNARLTCHQWNKCATRILRKETESVIAFGKFKHKPEKIEKLLKTIEDSDNNFPLLKFKLFQDVFTNINEKLIKSFFSIGHIISGLVIWLDCDSCVSLFDDLELNLPSLKSISWDDRRLKESDQKPLQSILKASPDLESLTLTFPTLFTFDDNNNNMRIEVSKNVAEIFKSCSIPNLKYLKLDIEFTNELLSSLTELNLQLKVLNLSLRSSSFDNEVLNSLINSQANSLIELRLTDLNISSRFMLTFRQTMSQLQTFEVQAWDYPLDDVSINNFCYFDKSLVPNLKKLILNAWGTTNEWKKILPTTNSSHHSLRFLKLPQEFMDRERIPQISKQFPDLKRLELHFASTKILLNVFKHLGNQLEELRIYQTFGEVIEMKNIDHVLTGLPLAECQKILKHKSFLIKGFCQSEKPALTNLTRLKLLDIKDIQYQIIVTDVSGYFAFLKMKSLKTLIMGRSQISDQCLRLLIRKYPNNMRCLEHIPAINCHNKLHKKNRDVPSKCQIF